MEDIDEEQLNEVGGDIDIMFEHVGLPLTYHHLLLISYQRMV